MSAEESVRRWCIWDPHCDNVTEQKPPRYCKTSFIRLIVMYKLQDFPVGKNYFELFIGNELEWFGAPYYRHLTWNHCHNCAFSSSSTCRFPLSSECTFLKSLNFQNMDGVASWQASQRLKRLLLMQRRSVGATHKTPLLQIRQGP